MTRPLPTEWNAVAAAKLTTVLGERPGRELMTQVLASVGLESLRSAADLRRFATALRVHGGFAEPLAGLLSLHATMYGTAE